MTNHPKRPILQKITINSNMTQRTFTTKSGTTFEWIETPETVKAVQDLSKFAGNYPGPLYAPHPHIKNETETDA